MNTEIDELWEAMKGPQYYRTCEKITRVIQNSQEDLFDVMNTVLGMVSSTMHTAVGTMWYYEKKGDGLIRPCAVFGGGDLSGVALTPGEGIAGQVIADNKPAVITDCQKDPRWAGEVARGSSFITRTMMCVPLGDAREAFGCIQMINKTDDTLFDDKDFEMAVRLAQIVSAELDRCGYLGGNTRQMKDLVRSFQMLLKAEPALVMQAMEQLDGYNKAGRMEKYAIAWHIKKLGEKLK